MVSGKTGFGTLLETAFVARAVGGDILTSVTPTGCVCATLPSFKQGDLLAIPITANNVPDGIVVVVPVSTIAPGSGGYVITWRHTLGDTPVDHLTLGDSIQYDLQQQPDKTASIIRQFQGYQELLCGAVLSKMVLTYNQNKESDIKLSLKGKDLAIGKTMTLSAGIDDAVTTIPVNQVLLSWAEAGHMIYQFADTGEIIGISGYDVAAKVLYADQRGGVTAFPAAAHLSGVELVPYMPLSTYNGYPIIDQGFAWLNDQLASLHSASVEDDEGYDLVNDQVGSRTPTGPYAPKKRVVKCNCEMFFLQNGPQAEIIADQWGKYNCTLQIGKTLGNIMAVDVLGIQTKPVKIDSVPDNMLKVKLDGEARNSDADYADVKIEHELHFAFM